MTETSVYRKRQTHRVGNKTQSAFYQTVILPSKTYKDKNKLPAEELIKTAKTYEKQTSLKITDVEKHRASCQKQICIEMLRKGYHRSFRELCSILEAQRKDREETGVEHPLHGQPLLDSQPDKLRFLGIYLNKAEEAERREQYSGVYKSYLQLASFFSKAGDHWLSELFYNKCLTVVQINSQIDSQLIAEGYLNVGLVYERKGDLMKALGYVEKYRQLSEHYYDLKIDASRQLTRLYIKLVEHYGNNAPIQYVIKAYEASKQSDDRKVENETSYKLGRAYLALNDVDSALKYFHQYYDYCQEEHDTKALGQALEALAVCYQKKENTEKVSEYLNKCLNNSSNKQDGDQYARACGTLAFIETTLGQHKSAIDSSSKAYSISLVNNGVDLDRHRVLFGIANGLKLRPRFIDCINQERIRNLNEWKSIRLETCLKK